MNEIRELALLRSHILDEAQSVFPLPVTRPALHKSLGPAFPHRTGIWLTDSINEQLRVLLQASLLRPAAGGWTLTERGRADRAQAARFLNKTSTTPPDAA